MRSVGAIIIPTLVAEKRALLRWLNDRIEYAAFTVQNASPVAVERGGKIVAVWAYHDQAGPDIHISVAADSPRWCSQQVLGLLLGYAFRFEGVQRITATIEAGNDRSEKLCRGAGFRHEGTKRKATPGGKHLHIFGMLRKEFDKRYLKDGRRSRRSTRSRPKGTGTGRRRAVAAVAGTTQPAQHN